MTTKRLTFPLASAALLALIAIAPVGSTTALVSTASAASARVVPEGNRFRKQPDIPFASARRTGASNSSYDAKFEKIVAVLKRDNRLISSIKRVANRYSIDPIHMIGAIVGEHTYNYDTLDSAQSYYIKALAYAGIDISFAHDGEHVEEFVERSQFDRCRKTSKSDDSDSRWSCYERVWNTQFRGKRVDGTRYPRTNFNETFFQPLFAGQSFGLGQLSPLTVLKMTDRVARQSGNPRLDAREAAKVYQATMDPNISLHYMAAVIQDSIEAYKRVGKVDISKNPGLTATLYNLGDPWGRAAKFRRSGAAWPQENYYGWLVNDRLKDLRAVLD
ncbi:DUF1402 family protein [Roseibium sp.]|uniref:DUF1402 family protein n=1 Tax=Roseibium sp. TaxID=1936156 RepID=UPI003A984E91